MPSVRPAGTRASALASALAGLMAILLASGCGTEPPGTQEALPNDDPPASAGVPPRVQSAPAAPSAAELTLQRLVRAGSQLSSVRDAAVSEIEGDAQSMRRPALEALAAPNRILRRGAAAALSRIADSTCVAEISAALERADETDSALLVAALGRTADRAAGETLLRLIEGADEFRAQRASSALAAFGGPVDLVRLRAATAPDRAVHVRRCALAALAGHAGAQDYDLFMAASRDPAPPVRAAAVRGLFASERITEADIRRLVVDDPHEAVRANAACAGSSASFSSKVAARARSPRCRRRSASSRRSRLDGDTRSASASSESAALLRPPPSSAWISTVSSALSA